MHVRFRPLRFTAARLLASSADSAIGCGCHQTSGAGPEHHLVRGSSPASSQPAPAPTNGSSRAAAELDGTPGRTKVTPRLPRPPPLPHRASSPVRARPLARRGFEGSPSACSSRSSQVGRRGPRRLDGAAGAPRRAPCGQCARRTRRCRTWRFARSGRSGTGATPSEVEEVLHDVAVDPVEPRARPRLRRPARGLRAAPARATSTARARASRGSGTWATGCSSAPSTTTARPGSTTAYDPEKEQELPLNLDARLRRQGPQAGALAPAAPGVAVRVGRLRRPSSARPSRRASTRRRSCATRASRQPSSRPISVWAGAAGAVRVFWNGVEILRDDKYRDLDPERFAADGDAARGVEPPHGQGVRRRARPPMLSLRVAGADGRAGRRPRGRRRPAPLDARRAAPSRPLGKGGRAPVGQRRGAGAGVRAPREERATPATLEAFARYLGATRLRRSRPSTARASWRGEAAEKAPTIERLLLAGELAESRNQRAAWIDKAEALVAARARHRARERSSVLLARAGYARGGVELARRRPVLRAGARARPGQRGGDAREGRALRRGGAARHGAGAPRAGARAAGRGASALLRATVAALRDEGRETEADEMAERYVALRFDDPAFARARIELAVARRDDGDARRAGSTGSLATNPDSAGALQTSAQAWTAPRRAGRAPSRRTARRSTSRPRTPT